MKKRVLLLAGCFSLATIAPAIAADGPYFTIMAGATFLDDLTWSKPGSPDIEFEHEAGFNVGGALGYEYKMFRLEGEIAYRKNKIDEFNLQGSTIDSGGDIDAISVMGNLYIDFENRTAWTPYIGAGAGWASLDVDELSITGYIANNDDDDGFAYQFIGGFGYEVSDALTANLDYRYFATDDPDFGAVEAEYESHNVIVGLRYQF